MGRQSRRRRLIGGEGGRRGGDKGLGLGERLARRVDPIRRLTHTARRHEGEHDARHAMPQGVAAENRQADLEPQAVTAERETERVGGGA